MTILDVGVAYQKKLEMRWKYMITRLYLGISGSCLNNSRKVKND